MGRRFLGKLYDMIKRKYNCKVCLKQLGIHIWISSNLDMMMGARNTIKGLVLLFYNKNVKLYWDIRILIKEVLHPIGI